MDPRSNYLIQIVERKTNKVVHHWAPGLEVEKEFETELVNRVRAKGVGIFKTESKVISALETALREMLYELKDRV